MKSNSCPTWISDILLQKFSTQCVHSRALNLGIRFFLLVEMEGHCQMSYQNWVFLSNFFSLWGQKDSSPIELGTLSVSLSLVGEEAGARRNDGLSSHSTSRQSILERTGVEDDMKKKNLKSASQFCCQIKKPIKKLGRAEGIITPRALCTTGVELSVPEDGSHSTKQHRRLRGGPVGRISNISLHLQSTLKTKGCSTSL